VITEVRLLSETRVEVRVPEELLGSGEAKQFEQFLHDRGGVSETEAAELTERLLRATVTDVGEGWGAALRPHVARMMEIRTQLKEIWSSVLEHASGPEHPTELGGDVVDRLDTLFADLDAELGKMPSLRESVDAMPDRDPAGTLRDLLTEQAAHATERGRTILDIWEERAGTSDEKTADLLEELDVEPSKTYPGRKPQPQKFDVGNFSHTYAEMLIDADQLPRGLEAEYRLILPEQGEVRMDRVDWDKGVIYEIKPNSPDQVAAGWDQVDAYVHYMNEHHPLGPGRSWTGEVVQYNKARALAVMRKIGWLP